MHLADGVLTAPVLLGSAVLGAGAVGLGLRQLDDSRLPLAALLGSAFFVAGTIHVPVGVGSVHLILNGLAGLLLGWAVFPAMLVALVLQAVLFGFGGFAVLGVNLLILALPGVVAHYVCRSWLHRADRARLIAVGVGSALIGIGGAALLAALALSLSGGRVFAPLIVMLTLAHLPVLAVDAAIGTLSLLTLERLRPEVLARTAGAAPTRAGPPRERVDA